MSREEIIKLAEAFIAATKAVGTAHQHADMVEDTLIEALRKEHGEVPNGVIVLPSGELLSVFDVGEDDSTPCVMVEHRIL